MIEIDADRRDKSTISETLKIFRCFFLSSRLVNSVDQSLIESFDIWLSDDVSFRIMEIEYRFLLLESSWKCRFNNEKPIKIVVEHNSSYDLSHFEMWLTDETVDSTAGREKQYDFTLRHSVRPFRSFVRVGRQNKYLNYCDDCSRAF